MTCMLNILSTDTSCVLAHFLQYRKHDMHVEYPFNWHIFYSIGNMTCMLNILPTNTCYILIRIGNMTRTKEYLINIMNYYI